MQVNQLVLSPDAGQALGEMNALLEEGGDISKERWEELQNRINAGRTDGIVTPELLEQMRAARETDKDEKSADRWRWIPQGTIGKCITD